MNIKTAPRIETDNLGSKELPRDALYGIQTARAYENFALFETSLSTDKNLMSGEKRVSKHLIDSIVLIKKAAAATHKKLKTIEDYKAEAIIHACEVTLSGNASEAFITHAYQGGAGTSTNMNVNEVIANLALKHLGKPIGDYAIINPFDDVNKGQSTNDVYPTALRITSIRLVRELSDACAKLQESLQLKEKTFADVLKLGRTELMDALPITLGQEFGSYAQAIARDRWRIYKIEERLRQVNIGGTAVGVGSNVSKQYTYQIIELLRSYSDIGLARAEYPMDLTQNNDVFVEVSGLLKALAVNLMKISTDLRWMNSGPNGGLGEIILQPLQAGSTIMPGKVNPVIPEMVTQVAIKVMANDTAIAMSAANGNFELNAFLPLIADCLIESLELLTKAVLLFKNKCIDTLIPNKEGCLTHLEHSNTSITALTPYIGYKAAEEILLSCGNDRSKIKNTLLSNTKLDEETINQLLNDRNRITYL